MPATRMSAWPRTLTKSWRRQAWRIFSCASSVRPAAQAIRPYAAGTRWKTFCRSARGARCSVQRRPASAARSKSVKSSSRLPRNAIAPWNILLLSAVSMWKTLRCWSMTLPMRSTELDDDLQHDMAHVGSAHRRQGQRDVVDGDDHPHARTELRVQRVAPFGMVDGPADRGPPIGQLLDRRIGKHHARSHGDLFEEDLRVGEQHARRGSLFLDDDLRILVVALAQPVQRAHGNGGFTRN